jgi:hypothetical protein
MFVGVHAMLAMQTKTPELAIEPVEAASFMKAAQNVLRHYSVQTTQKTLDWIAFLGVAGGMYGTRAFAISARLAAERATKGDGKVMQFRRPVRVVPETEPASQPGGQVAPMDYVPSVPPGETDFPGF